MTMNIGEASRRQFLLASLSGLSSAWLALRWPAILAAQEHAQRAEASGHPAQFQFFSPEDAVEVEAIAAQIIPSGDIPGAQEARVIYFIDRALTTFDKDKQKDYAKGLKDLQATQKKMFPKSAKFSELSSDQQILLLKKIEKTEFFNLVRNHTVMGFLIDPSYGGNFNQIGWKLIGFEDQFNFKPPFGYYDRDYKETH